MQQPGFSKDFMGRTKYENNLSVIVSLSLEGGTKRERQRKTEGLIEMEHTEKITHSRYTVDTDDRAGAH